MSKIHHYMVDFEDEAGTIRFANETPIHSLSQAKQLAKDTSLVVEGGSASAVAFSENGDGTFTPVGHVAFYLGEVSDEDGLTA